MRATKRKEKKSSKRNGKGETRKKPVAEFEIRTRKKKKKMAKKDGKKIL
jgi:hypothetical protein